MINVKISVRERAKRGNVVLRAKHLKKMNKLIGLGLTNSFKIYRILLGMGK